LAATQAPSSPEFSGGGGGRGGGIGGGVGGSRRFARLRAKFRLVLSAGASTFAPEWSHVVAVVAPLRSAPAFTCPVCLEPPAGLAPVVTMCGHVFCSADWLSCVASASRGAIDAICASAPPPLGHPHAAAAARAALSSVALQCPLCAEWLEGDGVRPIWFGGAPYEKAAAVAARAPQSASPPLAPASPAGPGASAPSAADDWPSLPPPAATPTLRVAPPRSPLVPSLEAAAPPFLTLGGPPPPLPPRAAADWHVPTCPLAPLLLQQGAEAAGDRKSVV
jgi:hypothetical protein